MAAKSIQQQSLSLPAKLKIIDDRASPVHVGIYAGNTNMFIDKTYYKQLSSSMQVRGCARGMCSIELLFCKQLGSSFQPGRNP